MLYLDISSKNQLIIKTSITRTLPIIDVWFVWILYTLVSKILRLDKQLSPSHVYSLMHSSMFTCCISILSSSSSWGQMLEKWMLQRKNHYRDIPVGVTFEAAKMNQTFSITIHKTMVKWNISLPGHATQVTKFSTSQLSWLPEAVLQIVINLAPFTSMVSVLSSYHKYTDHFLQKLSTKHISIAQIM